MKNEDLSSYIKQATNEEVAQLLYLIDSIKTVVVYNPDTQLCCHFASISIIDDAIHLILNPKETF